MINITGEKAKQRARAQQERQWVIFQNTFMKQLNTVMKKQYSAAAVNVASYNLDFNYSIDKYRKEMTETFNKHYKRVLTGFGQNSLQELEQIKGFENYQTKSFIQDFWRHATLWLNTVTANKVTKVMNTTKRNISKIVKNEMEAGNSNYDIAKQIKKIAEIAVPFRARKIARTETHSAANYAMTQSMTDSRMIKQKEWISALDERTRQVEFNHVLANGERVDLNDTFKRTGENLDYPGDMDGSAGNIINCRCGSLFYTDVKVS